MRRARGLATTSSSTTSGARREAGLPYVYLGYWVEGSRADAVQDPLPPARAARPRRLAALLRRRAGRAHRLRRRRPARRRRAASKAAARTARLAASSSTSSPESRCARPARCRACGLGLADLLAARRAGHRDRCPTLEELIPDEAVANPEAWARAGRPARGAAAAEQAIRASSIPTRRSPRLPQIDIPWPEAGRAAAARPARARGGHRVRRLRRLELPQVDDGRRGAHLRRAGAGVPERARAVPAPRRVPRPLQGAVDDRGARRRRQRRALAAQARADEDLLQRMLRVYGYYDALVFRSVGGIEPGEEAPRRRRGQPTVRFDIMPGPAVPLRRDRPRRARRGRPPTTPMLRDAFEIQTGDPLLCRQDRRGALRPRHARSARAAIRSPRSTSPTCWSITPAHEGDLTLPVTPGRQVPLRRRSPATCPSSCRASTSPTSRGSSRATSTSAASSSTCAARSSPPGSSRSVDADPGRDRAARERRAGHGRHRGRR